MFRFEYPIVTPTLTLDLRDPEFGDTLRIDHQAIIRGTRSDELKSFKDPTWPNIETNVYQFTALVKAKIDEVRAFLATTAGLRIAINTDHLGQTWHGVIISPVSDIVTQRDNCSFDFNFEFQGIKQ